RLGKPRRLVGQPEEVETLGERIRTAGAEWVARVAEDRIGGARYSMHDRPRDDASDAKPRAKTTGPGDKTTRTHQR
ncbi:MAG: hypothetical protein AAGA55_07515, partial [Planctomycetota bacterium]